MTPADSGSWDEMALSKLARTFLWLSFAVALPATAYAQGVLPRSPEHAATSIVMTSQGPWVGTTHGAYRTDVGLSVQEDLAVNDIAEFDHRLWLGARRGLYILEGTSAPPVLDTLVPAKEVRRLVRAPAGLLVGGRAGLLLRGRDSQQDLLAGETVNTIESIENAIWVGSAANAYWLASGATLGPPVKLFPDRSVRIVSIRPGVRRVWFLATGTEGDEIQAVYSLPLSATSGPPVPLHISPDLDTVVDVATYGDSDVLVTERALYEIKEDVVLPVPVHAADPATYFTAARTVEGDLWLGSDRGAIRLPKRASSGNQRFPTKGPFYVEDIKQIDRHTFFLTRQGAFSFHQELDVDLDLSSIPGPWSEIQPKPPLQVEEIGYRGCGELGCEGASPPNFQVAAAEKQKDLDEKDQRGQFNSAEEFQFESASRGLKDVFFRVRDGSGNHFDVRRSVLFSPTVPDIGKNLGTVALSVWLVVLVVSFVGARWSRKCVSLLVFSQSFPSIWLLKLLFTSHAIQQRLLLSAYRQGMIQRQGKLPVPSAPSTNLVATASPDWADGAAVHYVGDENERASFLQALAHHAFSASYPGKGKPLRTAVIAKPQLYSSLADDARLVKGIQVRLNEEGGIRDLDLVISMLESGGFLVCLDLSDVGTGTTEEEANEQKAMILFARQFADRFGARTCILVVSPKDLTLGAKYRRVDLTSSLAAEVGTLSDPQ